MELTLEERIKMAAQMIDHANPTAADWICCADTLQYCLVDAIIEKRKAMDELKAKEVKDVQG